MNSFLLNRQLGSVSPQALANAQNHRLLRSLQNASDVHFALGPASSHGGPAQDGRTVPSAPRIAHGSGVNSIVIDPFEGR